MAWCSDGEPGESPQHNRQSFTGFWAGWTEYGWGKYLMNCGMGGPPCDRHPCNSVATTTRSGRT